MPVLYYNSDAYVEVSGFDKFNINNNKIQLPSQLAFPTSIEKNLVNCHDLDGGPAVSGSLTLRLFKTSVTP